MAALRARLAVSLDGFIADPDGGTDWFDAFPAIATGFESFLARIDTLVMGRATYDRLRAGAAGGWPYPGRRCLVVTSHSLDTAPDEVEPWLGDLAELADELHRGGGGDVWVVGGGTAIRAFLDLGAIDYLDLLLVPCLRGDGRRLFPPSEIGDGLTLLSATALEGGVVALSYRLGG